MKTYPWLDVFRHEDTTRWYRCKRCQAVYVHILGGTEPQMECGACGLMDPGEG